jgi:3-hydroxybutyryl-CoA dehydrogenase
MVEAATQQENHKAIVVEIFSQLNKTVKWVPNVNGFISPRVVSMIINEAYFALQEKVSTKENIDTAMKLGTNYPFGPFEWSNRIGLKNVFDLLNSLSKSNPRYQPAPLLKEEALANEPDTKH